MHNYIVLEYFKKYIEEAKRNNQTEELRLFKLIIFGPPRAGKSTLFKVLKDDKDLEKESNSTGVCNRQLFKVAIIQQGAKCQSKWSEVGINEEISRLQSALEEKSKTEETKKLSAKKSKSGKNLEEKNKSGNSTSPSQTEVEKKCLKHMVNLMQIVKISVP